MRSLPRSERGIAWILSILAIVTIPTNVSQLLFGTDPQRMPSLFSGKPLLFWGVRVLPEELLAIAATVAIAAGLHLLQHHTLYGKAMKAAARDPANAAAMLGIRVDRCIAAAFALPACLAAIEGFLRDIGKEMPEPSQGSELGFEAVNKAIGVLTDFEAELSYLLSDRQQLIRSRAEIALAHLQRLLTVDEDARTKWSKAFHAKGKTKGKGEVECEKLGGLHFLWHGILGFEINAAGGRTDLVLNDVI